MSIDEDNRIPRFSDIMSVPVENGLFATESDFRKAKGEEAPMAKKADPPSKSQPGLPEDPNHPTMNMRDQTRVNNQASKFGTPNQALPKGKDIQFDPSSGEAVYWRGRNFPANQTDMAKFSKRIRSGEYLPIWVDGDTINIGANGVVRESYPVKDFEESGGSIADLLQNSTPAKWRGMDILGAVPASQYESGILPQIIATSGSGKARGEERGQNYSMDDKASFSNAAVYRYLKDLIRGTDRENPQLGSQYYERAVGDMMTPELFRRMQTIPEEEKAGLGGLSDDELAIKYPGMRRLIADLIANGGLSTTDMDSLAGLSGDQFRNALGKLAVKSNVSNHFGDEWQRLRNAATADDHTRSEAIRGGKRIGKDYHDPTGFTGEDEAEHGLDVDSMIDYLTSMEGDRGIQEREAKAKSFFDKEAADRFEDKQFMADKVMKMAEELEIPLWQAQAMFDEYTEKRNQERAEDQAASDAWTDKQIGIDKMGRKAQDIQSKANKTAAEYFGNDKMMVDNLDYNPNDLTTLYNVRDEHNNAINSAIEKLYGLYGEEGMAEKYPALADYRTGPLFPVGKNVDKDISDMMGNTGMTDEAARKEVGRQYGSEKMARILNILRRAMNEPGNEDLLRKYNESREAQGAKDFQEMFKPKNQTEEDAIKTYQEIMRSTGDEARAMEAVNAMFPQGEEARFTPEMLRRMTTPQDQYHEQAMAETLDKDAERGAEIRRMANPTGVEEQANAMSPTKEEAQELAEGYGKVVGDLKGRIGEDGAEKVKLSDQRTTFPVETQAVAFKPDKAANAQVVESGEGKFTPGEPIPDPHAKDKQVSEDAEQKETEGGKKKSATEEQSEEQPKKKQDEQPEILTETSGSHKSIPSFADISAEMDHDLFFKKSEVNIPDYGEQSEHAMVTHAVVRDPWKKVTMNVNDPIPSEVKDAKVVSDGDEHSVKSKIPRISELMQD